MTSPVQNEYYKPWKPELSHTLNAFWLPHAMQQHVIDISINITTLRELESTTVENYPNVNTLLETLANNSLRGGRVGKLLHCAAGKKKWITWPSGKLTSWLLPRSPIQCERTSFPASFASLAGRKHISSKTKLPLPTHPQLHSLNQRI